MKKLSEIIHYAADYVLHPTAKLNWYDGEVVKQSYSCIAFYEATRRLFPNNKKTQELLRVQFNIACLALGLNPWAIKAFLDVPEETRQEVRYAWLKFLALLAEEQGL